MSVYERERERERAEMAVGTIKNYLGIKRENVKDTLLDYD